MTLMNSFSTAAITLNMLARFRMTMRQEPTGKMRRGSEESATIRVDFFILSNMNDGVNHLDWLNLKIQAKETAIKNRGK